MFHVVSIHPNTFDVGPVVISLGIEAQALAAQLLAEVAKLNAGLISSYEY